MQRKDYKGTFLPGYAPARKDPVLAVLYVHPCVRRLGLQVLVQWLTVGGCASG